MKKRGIYIILPMAIFAFVWASAHSQEQIPRLDNSEFENPKKVPSIFGHEDHNEAAAIEECNVCHHVYENGKKLKDETSEDELCSECHKANSSGNTPSLMNAFHVRCKSCHMTKKKGPIMCGECHVK